MQQNLEKLWIWQEASELNNLIFQMLEDLPRREYSLKSQIDRSSQSVSANIAEMYGAHYPKVKIKTLRIARKEAFETINHIEVILKRHYWNNTTCKNLQNKYNRLIFGINKYIHYLSNLN